MQAVQEETQLQSFDQVPRESLRVLIGTATGLEIRGTVHLIPGTRLRDLVERGSEGFIAVTCATIIDARGQKRTTAFLAVNKMHVVTIEEVRSGLQSLPEPAAIVSIDSIPGQRRGTRDRKRQSGRGTATTEQVTPFACR